MTWREQLDANGFCFLRDVFGSVAVASALAEWEEITRANATNDAVLGGESGPAYGARNLLEMWPRVTELVRAPVLAEALCAVLGRCAGVVRALYFDKPPGHSWALPWHKDYSLAVREHIRSSVFTK